MKQITIILIAILLIPFAAMSDNHADKKAELDAYWKQVSQTVQTGDAAGYQALYHSDAVVVTGRALGDGGPGSTSLISDMIKKWQAGFDKTKAGEINANVIFRFSDTAVGSGSAHQTGVFHYFTVNNTTRDRYDVYVNFDALLVKKDGKWLMVMEHQKSLSSRDEFITIPR